MVRGPASVGGPEIGIACAGCAIAILHPVAGLFRCSGAEIDRQHRGPVHRVAKPDVFVGSELVAFKALPGQFAYCGALGGISDAIHPVVARGEVSAGVAHRGHVQASQRMEDIRPTSVGIRMGAVRLIDALIDRPPHVFQESAENAGINRADLELAVQVDGG